MTPRETSVSGPRPARAPTDSPSSGADVRVHIERLVVTGVPVADRAALGVAVQERLAELFAEHGGPTASFESRRVDGDAIRPTARATDGELGAQIARVVHGGLTR